MPLSRWSSGGASPRLHPDIAKSATHNVATPCLRMPSCSRRTFCFGPCMSQGPRESLGQLRGPKPAKKILRRKNLASQGGVNPDRSHNPGTAKACRVGPAPLRAPWALASKGRATPNCQPVLDTLQPAITLTWARLAAASCSTDPGRVWRLPRARQILGAFVRGLGGGQAVAG